MSNPTPSLYARRNTESLGDFYQRHVEAMTAEGLHGKSAIAAELAHRDALIAEMLGMLKRLEWKGWDIDFELQIAHGACPVCEALADRHSDGCELAAIIARVEGATK